MAPTSTAFVAQPAAGSDTLGAGGLCLGGGLVGDAGRRQAGQEGAQTLGRDERATATSARFDLALGNQGIQPGSANPQDAASVLDAICQSNLECCVIIHLSTSK